MTKVSAIIATTLLCSGLALAQPVGSEGAIVAPADYVHYNRLGDASDSEKVALLSRLAEHIGSEGTSVVDLKEVLVVLQSLLQSDKEDIVQETLSVLIVLGPKSQPVLATIVEVASTTTRVNETRILALRSIYETGVSATIVSTMENQMSDRELEIRIGAAALLSEHDRKFVPITIPVLLEGLESRDYRKAVIDFLGKLGRDGGEALPGLRAFQERLEQDRDEVETTELRGIVSEAIDKIATARSRES